jgi:glucose/mannose transport system substrate-binding protein
MALALAGCGGGDDDDNANTTPQASTVEIFSWWTSPGEAPALDAVIAAHKAAFPQVTVQNTALTVTAGADAARTLLGTRMDAKDPPDAFQQTGPIADWLARGDGIQALDAIYTQKGWDSTVSGFLLPGISLNNVKYAVPTNVHSQNYLFYNKAVLTANNITPPTTIAELNAACTKLKGLATPVTPFAASYQGWILRIIFDAVAVATGTAGGTNLKNLYAKTVDQAWLTDAMTNFDDLMTNCVNADANDPDNVGWNVPLGDRLADGTIAMFIHGDWLKGYLDSKGKTPGTDYDVVLFPGGASGTTFLFNADSFALPANAKNSAGAQDFLSTFLKPEVQEAFGKIKGACPANSTATALTSYDPVAKSICSGMRGATTTLLVEEKIDSILQTGYKSTPKTAVADMVTAIAAAYAP